MSNKQQGEVMTENPAWAFARKALESMEPVQAEVHPDTAAQKQNASNDAPINPQLPPQPQFQFNYNYGHNYNAPSVYGGGGGYHQGPGAGYPYQPAPQPYNNQMFIPQMNQRYPQSINHSMQHQPNYNYMPPPPPDPSNQQYDPMMPTDDHSRRDDIYQRPEYPQTNRNKAAYPKNDQFEQRQEARPESVYPSPWQSAQSESNGATIQKRTFSDVIKGNQKKPTGGFKMTFVSSSGSKKFKSAWHAQDSNANEIEQEQILEEEEGNSNSMPLKQESSENPTKDLPPQHDQNAYKNQNSHQVGQEKKAREWPPALKEYVKEAFDKCSNEHDKDQLERHFKIFLTEHLEDGTAYTMDWKNYPMPKLGHISTPTKQKYQSARPSRNQTRKNWSRSRSRSRSPSTSSGLSYSRSPTEQWRPRKERHSESRGDEGRGKGRGRKPARGGKGKREGTNGNHVEPTRKALKHFKIESSEGDLVDDPAVAKRKQDRASRFYDSLKDSPVTVKSISATLNVYTASDDEEDFDWNQFHIVGTSQELQKRYFRLTSAPDPSIVRPEHILKKSLELVKQKWKLKQDYHHTCEQLKVIRQDLTVQGIKNNFTVEVYETHARIALERADREEFNQCQTCLKALYKEGHTGHPDEFTAYNVIYYIYTQNTLDMSSCLASLTPEIKKSEAVQHALAVRSAWALCNYHSFFQLYLRAPNMSGYLIDLFADRVRRKALKIMLKSYRPILPIKYIESELAFTEEGACATWLKDLGATFTKDSLSLDSKASSGIFNSS